MLVQIGLDLLVDKTHNMKKYCLIKNGVVCNVGLLPSKYKNVSNFNLLDDIEILKYGWMPIQTISENKKVQTGIEYVIEKNHVKEIIHTRDKTQNEIDSERKHKIELNWKTIRVQRDNLLQESDFEIMPDRWEKMDNSKRNEFAKYRQELRDIPQKYTNIEDVVFPNKP